MKRVNVLLWLVLIGLLGGLTFAALPGVAADTAVAPAANWTTAKVISTGVANAKRPVIQAAPNQAGRIMTVFVSQQADNTPLDPYYTISNDFGATWTTPAPVHQSPGVESKQAHFDFDSQGVAHVAWREGRGLAYANSGGWAASYKVLSSPAAEPGVTTPVVATYGNNVHIVWSEGNINDPNDLKKVPNIYYTRSTDRGTHWLAAPVALGANFFDSVSPSLTVDDAGNVHVVWQELAIQGTPPQIVNVVKYVKGTVSANNVVWGVPIDISQRIVTSTAFNAQEPRITVSGALIEVTLTAIFQQPSEQYIYLMRCTTNCNNVNNWSNLGSVSGQSLYVNVEPVDLASTLTRRLNCTYVFFDGATTNDVSGREQVWTADGCRGWGAGRALITNNTARDLRPSSAAHEKWLYLVYEEVVQVTGGNNNKIYFMANEAESQLYLPVVAKR